MYRFILSAFIIGMLSASGVAQTTPGSAGGTIGKQDKSLSGGNEVERPRSPTIEEKPPRSRSKAESDSGTRSVTTVSGQWRWHAACAIGGQWHGEFKISQMSDSSFTGIFTSDLSDSGTVGSPVPQKITNGQLSGDQISFAREVAGWTQHWNGTITQASGGTRRMTGSITAIGCSWTATR